MVEDHLTAGTPPGKATDYIPATFLLGTAEDGGIPCSLTVRSRGGKTIGVDLALKDKRFVTLDLTADAGLDLALRVVAAVARARQGETA